MIAISDVLTHFAPTFKVRIWKRSIYAWAGESPTPSIISSRTPSEYTDSESEDFEVSPGKSIKQDFAHMSEAESPSKLLREVNVVLGADTVASLIGRFDIETMKAATLSNRENDESTLKANGSIQEKMKGPTDFSHLNGKTDDH